ncbi:MAG: ATP-dependent DNA helicase RecG [Christensenellales bacterium]|jgi:ATP-dependent DNA helicase RecG
MTTKDTGAAAGGPFSIQPRQLRLQDLRGLGKARVQALYQAGIHTVADLLMDVPVAYQDTSRTTNICNLKAGDTVCVAGTLEQLRLRYIGKLSVVQGFLRDDTGGLGLVWFNQPWMAKQLRRGDALVLYGRVERYKDSLSLQNPVRVTERGILPIYRQIDNVPAKTRAACVRDVLPYVEDIYPETLPDGLRERHGLMGLAPALHAAHAPQNQEQLRKAKRRFAFENLLLYQTVIRLLRRSASQGIRLAAPPGFAEGFWAAFPFQPTLAQQKALNAISRDMDSGRQMRRLLQGDVGSGKTAVALGAVAVAASNGYQSALMVPTEILARQHLESARRYLEPLGIGCGLLLGGMRSAERREALDAIASGAWQLVIGTHALLGEHVRYQNLGLVITDEQHRFGVRQRGRLEETQDISPHVLVMSATPIPRTLAMVVYGDLDVTVLNEMPKGRQPVQTRIVPAHKRGDMYAFIRQRVQAGEQAYVVCPLLEENEESDAASARGVYTELSIGGLKGLKLGLAYGSQTSQEKEETLSQFRAGKIQVLVATTVVEVGVDNPNATIMVIEGADRFGLSQLHQLRGRVGRGDKRSWCFLLGDTNDRLKALCVSQDGFAIAEKDLQLRGPGDFLGTRQHGHFAPDALGLSDMPLVEETRACVQDLAQNPTFSAEWAQIQQVAMAKYERAVKDIAMH